MATEFPAKNYASRPKTQRNRPDSPSGLFILLSWNSPHTHLHPSQITPNTKDIPYKTVRCGIKLQTTESEPSFKAILLHFTEFSPHTPKPRAINLQTIPKRSITPPHMQPYTPKNPISRVFTRSTHQKNPKSHPIKLQ